MAKPRTVFVCASCGADAPRWSGQCPSCGEWNTLAPFAEARVRGTGQAARGGRPEAIGHLAAVPELRRELDHHLLNEIEGLENPTCEAVARWIWRRLVAAVPGVVRIELYETDSSGCLYEGEDE